MEFVILYEYNVVDIAILYSIFNIKSTQNLNYLFIRHSK